MPCLIIKFGAPQEGFIVNSGRDSAATEKDAHKFRVVVSTLYSRILQIQPRITLIVGRVVVIHPSTGKLLTLVGDGALEGHRDFVGRREGTTPRMHPF